MLTVFISHFLAGLSTQRGSNRDETYYSSPPYLTTAREGKEDEDKVPTDTF